MKCIPVFYLNPCKLFGAFTWYVMVVQSFKITLIDSIFIEFLTLHWFTMSSREVSQSYDHVVQSRGGLGKDKELMANLYLIFPDIWEVLLLALTYRLVKKIELGGVDTHNMINHSIMTAAVLYYDGTSHVISRLKGPTQASLKINMSIIDWLDQQWIDEKRLSWE